MYDQTNNRLIIFGGANNVGESNNAWVLTNANGLGGTPQWRKLGPFPSFAEGRAFHTGVYKSTTNKMIAFGKVTFYTGAIAIFTNDVWVLNHANGK